MAGIAVHYGTLTKYGLSVLFSTLSSIENSEALSAPGSIPALLLHDNE